MTILRASCLLVMNVHVIGWQMETGITKKAHDKLFGIELGRRQ